MSKILITSLVFFMFSSLSIASTKTKKSTNKKDRVEKLIKEFEDDIPVPTVKVNELLKLPKEKIKQEYVIVDVRDDDEVKVSHIPGAISKKEFEKNIHKYKNKKIVPYCTIGYRSAKYTKKLVDKGMDAKNMRGSILLWLHEGGEVVDSSESKTNKVHVYGSKWDLLPKRFETYKK